MLSRVAENVFWLARYLERAESTVRLVKVHDKLLMDLSDADRRSGWQSLVSIAGMDGDFSRRDEHYDEASVTRFLLADPDNPGSLINAANAIRLNLRSSRDTLPQVLYERTNDLCRFIRSGIETEIGTTRRQAYLTTVEERLLAISGTLEGSLSHGTAYLIARMGCLIERADMTSRVLDVRARTLPVRPAEPRNVLFDEREWSSVLRSLSAAQMYRQHVPRPVDGPDVLRYLLLDQNLPRSYRFCLDHLGLCLEQLSENRRPLDALGVLQRQLAASEISILARDAAALHDFLDSLQKGLSDITDALSATCFPPPETESATA